MIVPRDEYLWKAFTIKSVTCTTRYRYPYRTVPTQNRPWHWNPESRLWQTGAFDGFSLHASNERWTLEKSLLCLFLHRTSKSGQPIQIMRMSISIHLHEYCHRQIENAHVLTHSFFSLGKISNFFIYGYPTSESTFLQTNCTSPRQSFVPSRRLYLITNCSFKLNW